MGGKIRQGGLLTWSCQLLTSFQAERSETAIKLAGTARFGLWRKVFLAFFPD